MSEFFHIENLLHLARKKLAENNTSKHLKSLRHTTESLLMVSASFLESRLTIKCEKARGKELHSAAKAIAPTILLASLAFLTPVGAAVGLLVGGHQAVKAVRAYVLSLCLNIFVLLLHSLFLFCSLLFFFSLAFLL